MSLAQDVIARASAVGKMVTAAESCTGGMVTAALTDVPGSSVAVERGFVTYSNAAKMETLGVQMATLEAYGAVSEEVAAEMARGALKASKAQVAVSVTGIAGPGGSEHKPEGRVCFGLFDGENLQTETVEFGPIGRANVRAAARDYALGLLRDGL